MDKDNKKVALVTGATGGIGSALCKKLTDDGFRVIAHYRNREKAIEWNDRRKEEGYNLDMEIADVSDYEAVSAMFQRIAEKIGTVDVIVNNAGITRDKPFHKMSPKEWNDVINADLNSVFNVTHHAWPAMREQKFGRIINISSVNGQRGQFGQTNYSAAKAGMHGFTKSLAMEGAAKGITVNTVSPGYVNTEMVAAVPEKVMNEVILPLIPMGRLAEPEEIANIVAYLASDEAAYVTGANFAINGGQHVY